MLLVPVHSTIDGITVFADDTQFWLFYLIPGTPTLRLDDKGNPVFLLVKYAFSDQDRQHNPSLPPGGGYLSFDTSLAVTPANLTAISTALQAEVAAEWSRRKAGTPAEQASPGVAATTEAPSVIFGEPTWTSGRVAMDAPQSVALVAARMAEGAPSLLGGSTAVFDLDLTPAGADFMEQTLVSAAGAGAADLTPIQVAYDLSFWARLPPVSIIVTADSAKVHDYIHKQLQGQGIDNCTTYAFDHTDITNDTGTTTGLITVSIDQGSGSLPPDTLTQLTNYAMDLVKSMISSSFFTSTPPPGATSDTAMPADDGTTRKWFLEVYDSTTMNLNVNLEQRSVVTWEIHPQATLESFFLGMSAVQLEPFVRTLDLNDPFFENLEVTARAFGDYAGPVQSVTVDLLYGPAGPTQKTTSLVFTDTTPQTWTIGLLGTERSFSYRYTVGYKNHAPAAPTSWVTTSSPQLNLEALAGQVAVSVVTGNIDFSTVSQVQVLLSYEDPGHGVDREDYTVLLSSTIQQANYSRLVYQPVTGSLRYQTRFTMVSGDVQDDGVWHDVTGSQLVINQDTTDLLKVNLLPTGNGWADVTKVLVELRYDDPANSYSKSDTETLTGVGGFTTWTVGLRDKTLRNFSYRWTASFSNGQLSTRDWTTVTDGSTVLPILLERPGITVSLVPDAMDFQNGLVCEVSCTYSQPGFERQETFVFKDKAMQQWEIDAPAGSPISYTYQVTWSLPGAQPVTGPTTAADGSVLILPPMRHLMIVALGQLVDYTATPLVGVSVSYDDPANDVHESWSVTLSSSAPVDTSSIPMADPAATSFTYTITYYGADGVAHAQSPVTSEQSQIVVPRLLPAIASGH